MKIKVLFDVAHIITNFNAKTGSRTGIFFAAYNILSEMLKYEELEVYLYSSTRNLGNTKYVFEKGNCPPLYCKIGLLDRLLSKAEYIYRAKYNKPVRSFSNDVSGSNAGALAAFKIKLKAKAKSIVRILVLKMRRLADMRDALTGAVRGFDVYFSPAYAVPDYIKKNKSIKSYVCLHDVIPLVLHDMNPNAEGDSWFFRLIKQIDKDGNYFTNSEYTRQDFIKHVPAIDEAKITTVLHAAGRGFYPVSDPVKLNGVRIKYGIPEHKRYFLSLCTVEPKKNLFFSVRNFLGFIKKNNIDDLIFVVAGGHWERFSEQIASEINNTDYHRYVVQTGYVDDEDRATLYSGAECFVFTSLYEGFGVPPLEAMQCGTPVISSNSTSLPEVVGNAALTVDPKNDEELISAYEKIYFDKSLREELSKKGVERSKLFSWEKSVNTIVNKFLEDMKEEGYKLYV